MKRAFSILFWWCGVVVVAAQSSYRPNILFIMADDMRADAIAGYGNRYIETPNLDKLIASGFSFRGNYVFGEFGGGMCAESRDVDDGQDMVPHRCSDDSELKSCRNCGENGYVTFGTGNGITGRIRGSGLFSAARQ